MPNATTIYIVRHGEKADDSGNPPLSPAGLARAKELLHVLADEVIDGVFATDFLRTQQTATPIAMAAGLPVQTYHTTQGLIDKIKSNHSGGRVLVVGHSDTADDIAAVLGISGLSDLPDHAFDRFFVIIVSEDGAHLNRLRYGAETR